MNDLSKRAEEIAWKTEFRKKFAHGLTQYGHKRFHDHPTRDENKKSIACNGKCPHVHIAIEDFIEGLLRSVRRETLEEAAKLAETCERTLFLAYKDLETMDRDIKVREQQRKEVANSIRELIDKESQ